MNWNIKVNDAYGVIDLFEKEAPASLRAISTLLPLEIDLHYAKIAGQEVYGMVPLILPLENRKKVGDLDAGTVAYFPDRQMFCIYHGEVQPEDAMVTVLGKLRPDPGLFEVLESVKTNASVHLYLSDSKDFNPKKSQVFNLPGEGWESFWENPIDEIVDLTMRKGQTMPSGPIISACGDALKLTGVLWEIRRLLIEEGHFDGKTFRAVTGHFQDVIGGWYGLRKSASAINAYTRSVCSGKNRLANLEEMILFSGKLHMWIDSLIPWEMINELFVKKYQQDH